MKAKLIKIEDGYELLTQGFLKGSTNHKLIDSLNIEEGGIRYKLSLKNCQAIERGYDLDELAYEYDLDTIENVYGQVKAFKAGFQKALELMKDKKFSEEDVILIAEYIRVASQSTPNVKTKDLFAEYQSLQQTEWDVEVVMKNIIDETKIIGAIKGVKGSGNKITTYKQIPKLDVDSCLTLKRT